MKISIFYNKSEIYNIFHIEVLLHSDLDSESDSALCPTEQSPTPRCAEQLLIFFNRKKHDLLVRTIRSVLYRYSADSDSALCY